MSSSRFEVERVPGDQEIVSDKSSVGSKTSLDESEEKGKSPLKLPPGKDPKQNDSKRLPEVCVEDESPVEIVTAVNEEETSEKGRGQSRFHVEFVEPEHDKSLLTPSSPTHDTQNSYTHTKTYYQRTFGHNTHEAIPMVAYYRNTESVGGKAQRPTLDQLHAPEDSITEQSPTKKSENDTSGDVESAKLATPVKFGWIKGVLVRCVLNIWGVMLFLRLSWIVGQAGVGFTLLIILLSSVVTVITTLSMSAICTNGQVRGGGAYYLISRSLGPEFGGAIGLIFSLANAVAVAMYVVGFSETVVDIMKTYNATMTGDAVNDARIIGTITVILLLGITQLGMAWEAKMQLVLLFILLVSIANFLIGTFIPAGPEKNADGFFNYQLSIAAENFTPSFRNGEDFFSLFAIFFPAATGILAGCNISGDLKDAQAAIPKGTLLAILITSITYAVVAVILGFVEVRFASGLVADFIGAANTSAINCTSAACQFGWNYTVVNENCTDKVDAVVKCYSAGLLNDYQAMQKISGFGPIILAGIFAATLSSALASLVSAPKIFQAVCRDSIFPFITVFGKGAPKTDEPQRGYILAFLIALGFILIGQLNVIAPIISNFFLASYTLINYSCFSASLAKSPGWRPAFKYYNMWLSLVGAVICSAIMFVIEWWAALVTIIIVLGLYKFVDYKKPDVNWGSSTQAYTYTQALNHTLKLTSVDDHVKNFRPQLMVLSGKPNHRPALVHFASQITKNVSLMVCANVKPQLGKNPVRAQMKESHENQRWLKKQHLRAFYTSVVSPSITEGVLTMMQLSGLGKLQTNTILMGFKCDWQQVSGAELASYINILHNAFDLNYGVCILRMKEGLDVSHYLSESDIRLPKSKSDLEALKKEGSSLSGSIEEVNESVAPTLKQPLEEEGSSSQLVRIHADARGSTGEVNTAALKATSQFQTVQGKGKTIDVWWLFDDGGLTILIPYLLSTRQQWSGCRMRIFTGGKKERIDQDKRTMAQLLTKFRISFEDVIVVPDINEKPQKTSIDNFNEMIRPYRLFDEEDGSGERSNLNLAEPWKITDNEMRTYKDKIYRQIRLQELLQKHSKDAALIIMTLPIGRKGICSSSLYMAWLEELTRDLPPIVLIRGNQTSVVTFYS
ncbi:solute carrier family 12 member 2-like [Clavelina lepadiformis]|uniref:solute carrier family 12 member 2-like n=1 Tax=Clavelina lepadiformis TaxID=159417 RepID=UPI00404145CB